MGDGQDPTSVRWPESRAWIGVWGGVLADALPSGRAQGSGLCPEPPPRGQSRRRAHPGSLSGPAASSSPPRPSVSRGRPRPRTRARPSGGGGGSGDSTALRRVPASPPRPESRRGAVSACVARARAGGGGLCLRPRGAGPPDRVPCPSAPGARPSPPVRGAARLGAPEARGGARIQARPNLAAERAGARRDLPSPGRPWRRLVGACDYRRPWACRGVGTDLSPW